MASRLPLGKRFSASRFFEGVVREVGNESRSCKTTSSFEPWTWSLLRVGRQVTRVLEISRLLRQLRKAASFRGRKTLRSIPRSALRLTGASDAGDPDSVRGRRGRTFRRVARALCQDAPGPARPPGAPLPRLSSACAGSRIPAATPRTGSRSGEIRVGWGRIGHRGAAHGAPPPSWACDVRGVLGRQLTSGTRPRRAPN